MYVQHLASPHSLRVKCRGEIVHTSRCLNRRIDPTINIATSQLHSVWRLLTLPVCAGGSSSNHCASGKLHHFTNGSQKFLIITKLCISNKVLHLFSGVLHSLLRT